MEQAVILSAVRTPVGKFLGSLERFSATELGAMVVREAVSRAGIEPQQVDECIMGNVVSAGLGQAPARQAALRGGLSNRVAALTVNKVCGSGLKAVGLAANGIKVGDIEIAVAGGMESMSNAPYLLPKVREGYRMGNAKLVDSLIHDGLWDVYGDYHMGSTAEIIAKKFKISREAQDEYALNSHRRAVAAIQSCRFSSQILPVAIPQKKGEPVLFSKDEGPRGDTTMQALSALKPAFEKDGTVTAGNSSTMNDGAAAAVVTSERLASKLGKQPLARIAGQTTSGVEPSMIMMAPQAAIEMLLKKVGWKLDDVDLFEINEAFAVQLVALIREMKLNPEKVNVNGGAVAIGHPIGASGARLLTTLLYEMAARNAHRGVVALCLGGGNAVAMAVER
jgi:acetyl-CoA C-acetyltransferase